MNVVQEVNQDNPEVQVLFSELYHLCVDQFTAFCEKWDPVFVSQTNYLMFSPTIKASFISLRYSVWEYLKVQTLEHSFITSSCKVENEVFRQVEFIVLGYADVFKSNRIKHHRDAPRNYSNLNDKTKLSQMCYDYQLVIWDWIQAVIRRFPTLNRCEMFASLSAVMMRVNFDILTDTYKDCKPLVVDLRHAQKEIAVKMEQVFRDGIKMKSANY